MNKPRR